MEYFFVHVVLLCLFVDQSCCCFTKSKYKEEKIIKRYYPGTYSEGTFHNKLECMNLRYTPEVKRTPDYRISPHCVNAVPGLSFFEQGNIPNFFYENFNDYVSQRFDQVLYLTCGSDSDENDKKFMNYTVPSEIVTIFHVREVSYETELLSNISIISTLENDTGLIKPKSRFLLNIPLMRSDIDFIGSAAYVEIIKQDFQVQLRDDVKPNQHVISKYNELPDNWLDNTDAYYEFIMQFGTHVRTLSTFGGSLMLLASQRKPTMNLTLFNVDDIVAITGFVTQIINIKKGEDMRITLLALGGFSSLTNSTEWMQSTIEEPVPVSSMYTPLNVFIDKSNSTKSQSLAQMIAFEGDHQVYKKYLYQLELLNHKDKLSEFVRSRLNEQLQYVCSSSYINGMIKSIELENNINLDKFFLKFTTNELVVTDSMETHLMYKNTIPLIPFVCFSFYYPLNTSAEPNHQLLSNIKCLQIFGKENCSGEGIRLYQSIDMQDVSFNFNITSVMMCNPQ